MNRRKFLAFLGVATASGSAVAAGGASILSPAPSAPEVFYGGPVGGGMSSTLVDFRREVTREYIRENLYHPYGDR